MHCDCEASLTSLNITDQYLKSTEGLGVMGTYDSIDYKFGKSPSNFCELFEGELFDW